MSTLKLSISIFLFIFAAGCTQFSAFEDRRREPGTEYIWVGASKPDKPAICYNPLFYSQEDIKEQADEICKKQKENTHAKLVDIDYFSCRLFVPSKAYYECVVDN